MQDISKNISNRRLFLLGALACLGLLAGAYFIQYGLSVEPCPLCILQRVMLWIMGGTFVLGALHNPKSWGVFVYTLTTSFFGILGLLLTVRQVWLQNLPPDQVPSCTAGFDRLLEVYPIFDVLKTIITSSGECSVVDFRLLGLPLSVWSLFSFVLLICFCVSIFILEKQRRI